MRRKGVNKKTLAFSDDLGQLPSHFTGDLDPVAQTIVMCLQGGNTVSAQGEYK